MKSAVKVRYKCGMRFMGVVLINVTSHRSLKHNRTKDYAIVYRNWAVSCRTAFPTSDSREMAFSVSLKKLVQSSLWINICIKVKKVIMIFLRKSLELMHTVHIVQIM